MNKICIALLFLLLGACTHKKTETKLEKHNSHYPKLVDSLNIDSLYDLTKWNIYCIQCDDTLVFHKQKGITDTITFASLDLRFDTIQQRGDSIELNFLFYYQNKPCDVNMIKNGSIWGIVYSLRSGAVICYSTESTIRYYMDSCISKNCPSRLINPLQPEVVNFINNNKSKLNPWFYSEAKKRGVIKN